MFEDSRRVMATTVLLVVAASSLAASNNSPACSDAGVREARERFNTAIAGDDFAAIAAILTEEVVLVTGSASDTYFGASRQVALWQSDVGAADRLRYVRVPSNISLSPLYPLAMEAGDWTGTAGDGATVGGEYSAKWRCQSGEWLLEAEIFMTTRCSGRLCD